MKIVIIGPESTGKSTLCKQLAEHYKTLWCPEYARAYLEINGTDYNYQDLLKIAQGQLALEEWTAAETQGALYIADTDIYVIKVWYEVVFGDCPPWVLKQCIVTSADLYLLCDTDLPWTADPLREYPDLEQRRRLFYMYKDIMVNQDRPWAVISGREEERLEAAIKAVEDRLREEGFSPRSE